MTDRVPVPHVVSICVGSSSPHNSDDEQKVNNFIEKVKTQSRKFSKMVASDLDRVSTDLELTK